MTDIFHRLGLRRVINASGTETPLGASPVRSEVIEAVAELVPHSVNMLELQSAASRTIARAVGTEAGCVTGCTAASIAISAAACMTGRDLGRVEQLPDTAGLKNEVVMQKGHEVTYGQNVSQNVRLTGARMVEIGAATQCGVYQLRHAINECTAAALYVVSHLTVQNRMIDLGTFTEVCRERGVPVIVDAASVPDPRPYVRSGAGLVLFSAQKALSSLTAGIIAGKRELVHACLYNHDHGIGRPMKVGKEGVIGAIVALERWMAEDNTAKEDALERRLARMKQTLETIKGMTVSRQGRQLRLDVDAKSAGLSAHEAAAALAAGDPAIMVWNHFAADGALYVTLAKLSDETADFVARRIAEVFARGRSGQPGPAPNIADAVLAEIERWPLAGPKR